MADKAGTVNFLTAKELADHLSELVDDEDFIIRTVRTHFPEYKREMRAKMKEPALPPIPFENLPIKMDAAIRSSMEAGSKKLLAALHKSHGRIMKVHHDAGRQVVFP